MLISLNIITQRISLVARELRENSGYAGESSAARLESELTMFVAGFKACQDAVIFEINHVVDPETPIITQEKGYLRWKMPQAPDNYKYQY